MGYTTEFFGTFSLDRHLESAHAAYLRKFSDTRRMGRTSRCESMPDPERIAVGLPIGVEGEFFVGGADAYGQARDASIIDYNRAPKTQPGLWCQWVPTDNGSGIMWNGAEKFYDYTEWLTYIIVNFLKPWGYKLSGSVEWQGEDRGDFGTIVVKANKVTTTKKSTHGRR